MVVDPNATNRAVRIQSIIKEKVTAKGNVVSNEYEAYFPFELIVPRQNQKNENEVYANIKVDD